MLVTPLPKFQIYWKVAFSGTEVLVKVTGSGPQPPVVSFVNAAVTPVTVIKVFCMLSDLQPYALVVTSLITSV